MGRQSSCGGSGEHSPLPPPTAATPSFLSTLQAFSASGVNKSTADYCAQVALPRSFFDDARGWAAVEAVAQPGSLPGGLDACSSRHAVFRRPLAPGRFCGRGL